MHAPHTGGDGDGGGEGRGEGGGAGDGGEGEGSGGEGGGGGAGGTKGGLGGCGGSMKWEMWSVGRIHHDESVQPAKAVGAGLLPAGTMIQPTAP